MKTDEFKTKLLELNQKLDKMKDSIATEEATKNAFVMPFIQLLGYNVFDPTEVVPEFIADIGTKKGEKVDYAIFQNGSPILIIECKHWKEKLDNHNSQLYRYFHVTKARFAILTNGIVYRFFADLEKKNIMDDRPFLEIDLSNPRDHSISELSKFHKSRFDTDNIISSASSLKYLQLVRKKLENELSNTSTDFVKHFANQVYEGRLTSKVVTEFRGLVNRALNQFINDKVNDRLQAAISNETSKPENSDTETEEDSKVVTTDEEIEGFQIVRAICRKKADVNRIVYRDAQSYFSVLLDNNNRKPICRLWLNSKTKYLGTFDEDKKETKVKISSVDDIYSHSSKLLKSIGNYEK